MKILLLGEFSGLFSNLRDGLVELGHDVVLASNGDGYKKFEADINLNYDNPNYGKVLNRIFYFKDSFSQIMRFKNYDVVQLVYDHLFSPVFYNKFLLSLIKSNNNSLYLTLAGSNSIVMRYWLSKKNTKVSILFNDAIKHDGYQSILSNKLYRFENQLALKVDGLIPVAYEYYQPYTSFHNLNSAIPLPINLKKIKYTDNFVNAKIVFFHGLNKYGFKGTKYIEQAFKIVKKRYPGDIETIVGGNLPYIEYLKLLDSANVVLDQTSSYSLGMNGLIALGLGKIVMGGAEEESIKSFGYEDCPVFNLKPDVEYIVAQMESVIQKKNEIPEIGYKSRKFVEKYHDHVHISKKYLEVWQKKIDSSTTF
jgi:hypothetical protein